MSEVISETAVLDQLRTIAAYIDELDGSDRTEALVEFYRSGWFHPGIVTFEGITGQIGREAHRAFTALLDRESCSRSWSQSSTSIGRASIARLTGCAGHASSFFATFPFRSMVDDRGEFVVGAAVGCERLHETRGAWDWAHFDIEHVILWNPKTNVAEIAGDLGGGIILPDDRERLAVYADPAAFFRAWVAARIDFLDRRDRWTIHQPQERRDNELPGALVIGGLGNIPWASIGAGTLIAGPGVDADELKRAVVRSAGLPVVERI
jgi:hypothetical protein